MALYTGKLNLSDEYREALQPLLTTLCEDAVAAHSRRDAELADNDNLLELVEMDGLPTPYSGSCTLNDILPLEQFITLYSQLMAALYRDTLATVTGKTLADKEGAYKTEAWLSDDWQECGYYRAKAMQFYNLLRDKAGILYGGYCDHVKQSRARLFAEVNKEGKFVHWDAEKGEPFNLIEQQHRQDGVEYAPVSVTQEEVERKAEYRAVNQMNLYLIPPDAPSIEEADLSVERRLLTKNNLLDGIAKYDYDEKEVMQLLAKGPTHEGMAQNYRQRSTLDTGETNQERENTLAGVERMDHTDSGVYECFLLFGRLPKIWETAGADRVEALLPKNHWETQCVVMLCPAHGIVFMAKPSPFPGWKPYTSVTLVPKPNRWDGRGLMDILEPSAREATHWLRLFYNAAEVEMIPEIGMDANTWDMNKNRERFPGKVWKLNAGGTIVPIPASGVSQLGTQPLQDIRSRTQALIGAQGAGEIQTKVRKEAEVVSAMTKADVKAQMYQYFAYLSVPEEAKRRVEMELLFNPDYVGQANSEEGPMEITAKDLAGQYRYSVATIGEDSSPEARSRRAANIIAIQSGYLDLVAKFPQYAAEIWNGARQALMAERVRDPDSLLKSQEEAGAAMAAMMPPPMAGGAPGGMGAPNPLAMNGAALNGNGAVPPMMGAV